MNNDLYITGAGVSAESGIPTFRGQDGYWTVGSKNYTPQQMATRAMYVHAPDAFLAWYYHRFMRYRHHGPNLVHKWLADKHLITQNIDGLDGMAGNQDYIAIHGRIDKMTVFHDQDHDQDIRVDIIDTPWDQVDDTNLQASLLALFHIDGNPKKPILNYSYKPFVLLFDEYYTNLYRIDEAQRRMINAERIIFMGTSFSVNITQIALTIAQQMNKPIEIVDPNPIQLPYKQVIYHRMKASDYVQARTS